jgi:O-antigen/teichoic acid export membrane protein
MSALGVGTAAGRGTRLIRNMVLARLLAPNEFGLMAMVMVATTAFDAFTEVGVKQSVIQNKHGAEPEYLNVVWWMQAVRGLSLFLIAVIAAPWISSFYDKPELLKLLRFSFFAILFSGLVSPRAYVLEKEHRFGRAVFLTQGSAIIGTITTIVLAFIIRNVWALVIGFVTEAAILCLVSYLLVPFMPRFRIHREYLGELMKFGRGMFGLPILTMVCFQADVLVLGKLVTNEQLGLYSLAATLAYLPIDLFSQVISPFLLPTFAERQDNKTSLSQSILQITHWTAVMSIPVITLMACCASGMLLLAYGGKYVAAAIPFSILSFQILTRTEGSILGTIYMAVGRPHLHRRFVILRAVIIVGLIYPAVVHFGLAGAAVVVVLGNFAALIMQIFWCQRIIDLKFGEYIRSYIPGVLLALPVIVTVSLLKLFGIESPVLVLVVGLAALIAAYAGYLAKISLSNCRQASFAAKKAPAVILDFTAPTEVDDV